MQKGTRQQPSQHPKAAVPQHTAHVPSPVSKWTLVRVSVLQCTHITLTGARPYRKPWELGTLEVVAAVTAGTAATAATGTAATGTCGNAERGLYTFCGEAQAWGRGADLDSEGVTRGQALGDRDLHRARRRLHLDYHPALDAVGDRHLHRRHGVWWKLPSKRRFVYPDA